MLNSIYLFVPHLSLPLSFFFFAWLDSLFFVSDYSQSTKLPEHYLIKMSCSLSYSSFPIYVPRVGSIAFHYVQSESCEWIQPSGLHITC